MVDVISAGTATRAQLDELAALIERGLEQAADGAARQIEAQETPASAGVNELNVIVTLWAAYVLSDVTPYFAALLAGYASEYAWSFSLSLTFGADAAFDADATAGQINVDTLLPGVQAALADIGDDLRDRARASLAEGANSGETIPQLAARVRASARDALVRARLRAADQAHAARNAAASAVANLIAALSGASGALQQRWQARDDFKTRPTHHAADGQTVAIGERFRVGGAWLAFPGDPSGPPAEVFNCRCELQSVFDAEVMRHAFRSEMRVDDDDEILTASVRRGGWSSLPVASADRSWSGPGAAGRVASSCGVDDSDASAEAWNCYARNFLYRDDDADPHTKGAYKLGVVDIVDGERTLIPRGVFAVAGVLQGARGGADIPEAQQATLKTVVSGLYSRINNALGTDYEVPWSESSASSSDDTVTASSLETGTAMADSRYVHVSGPIVVEGRSTGDRRQFGPLSLTWQQVAGSTSLEIPLGYQYERGHGHGGSDKVERVGRIDSIERVGGELIAHGVIDVSTDRGRQAAQQMGTRENPGTLAGVSVVVDEDPDGPGLAMEYQFPEQCETVDQDDADEFDMACMIPEREIITAGARIRAVDLVDIPAFAEARLYLDTALGDNVATGDDEQVLDTVTASAYTITIPDLPPVDWFAEPTDEPDIGAITVTDEGRIYGYLAPKHVAHRGYRDKRVEVPMKNVDYGVWMNRVTIADDGSGGFERLATGPITMDCGHAPTGPRMKGEARREHYDNACSVVATVRAGENARGVWIAGALLPDVTGAQVQRMMACQLSGDWGPHRERAGQRELAAALLVPVPGFPKRSSLSLRLQDGQLAHASVPVRFGVQERGPQTFGVKAAADRIAASIGRDLASRVREFAASRND